MFDAEQTLEMVERLGEYEPFRWFQGVSSEALARMGETVLDANATKEIREERFQQFLGAKSMANLFESYEQGLRLGLAQKKKNVK